MLCSLTHTWKKAFLSSLRSPSRSCRATWTPSSGCITPKSSPHTYVSQLQSLGVDMETIKSIVGHAEIDTTQHYLHVQAPIKQAAVAKFSNSFVNTEGNAQ